MQQCFTPTEKKRNKSRTSLGRQSPVASRPLSEASAAELALAYPACTAAEGPCPLPTGGDSRGVGQVPFDTHTQAEQRNTHWVWNRARLSPTRWEVQNKLRGLFIFKEVFQAHSPFLGSWVGVKSRYAWACLSQHEVYSKHLCIYCIQFVTCS